MDTELNLRRSAIAAALVIGAMTVGAGAVHAEPAPAAPEPIDYSVKLVDKTIVTTLRGGTFSLVEKEEDSAAVDAATDQAAKPEAIDVAEIKDASGNTVLELPLVFNVLGTEIPVKPELKNDGTVLEITPEKPAGLNLDKPVAVKPVASAVENQRAQNDFASKFGIGTAIGGFVGTAIGAVIGCVVTIPAGCLPGLITGASVGGILGTVAVGGPTLVAAGIELINTLQAPEGTTQWADKPKEAQATK
ncbi:MULTISPECIES: hypothetical protein [Nocardia]|uniref:DUF8020 domain-containing protein n=1 Tax=Nocardia farcinica TaxID=37329 RepID=A0A0H5P1U5_NOCFR|nr:hypothetical protein [Nocardia farcinica]PFX02658.1 hypothetical protein CJ469_02174 [Nocardia farcinica]PFX03173.1 hypothetical protein CJ468_05739 [Nocardia farcinica]CRY81498.1 Uncharacterised protein [Nocardia farcinica]SIT13790.1 hypothetical protein SAMN05421776_103554 [Nocardia farcinica]SUE31752.1 hypothetical membrane protein [Nocardia farcinica]